MGESIPFNIDDPKSVEESINRITSDWFDPKRIYFRLKASSITYKTAFWGETQYLLESIANALSIAYEDFNREFTNRCHRLDLRIMAYHCTRSQKPQNYIDHGVLALNEKVLWAFFSESAAAFPTFFLSEDEKERIISRIIQTNDWKHRVRFGPNFFFSYQYARNQNNDFLKSGSEIRSVCVDKTIQYCSENNIRVPANNGSEWRERIARNMKPIIIHCLIPYSILPNKPYCSFCMLKSLFNNLDPEDNFIEDATLHLGGTSLDPKHIIDIEEL